MIQLSGTVEVRVPGKIHPPHSLLGLALRHRFGDGYRAETVYLVLAVMLVSGAVVAGFAASALGLGALEWPDVLLGVGLAVCAFAGYRRDIEVRLTTDRLCVRQGRTQLEVLTDTIRAVDVLNPLTYHRVDARLPGVQRFVNDYRHRLVRIRTEDGTLVLGIPEAEASAVLARLRVPSRVPERKRSFAEA